MEWLRPTAESLAPAPDLTHARRLLTDWSAPDAARASTRDEIVAFIDAHPDDAHLRSCLPGHLTGSALAIDADGERVLLHLHKKLGRWLQFGGHCDGDANMLAVAWRETSEESGLTPGAISALPIDVDIHSIPARKDEPEHNHLDVRYLVRMPAGAVPEISEESLELAWFTRAEALQLDLDPSLRRLMDLF